MRKLALLFLIAIMAVPLLAVQKKKTAPKTTHKTAQKKPPTGVRAAGLQKPGKKSWRNRIRNVVHRSVPVSPHIREAALTYVSEQTSHVDGSLLENPAALVPFFELISHPSTSGSLHILQYGDSHTASDDWANAMRVGLQSKFGSGGPGFGFAGHPYRGYRRFDLSGNNSSGWYTDGLVGHPGDGRYGLGGVSLTTQSAGETVTLSADCADLQLFFLRQPGGGQLEFSIDGTPVETITTDGELGPGYFDYKPVPGSHQFGLRTLNDAPVRLFGWVAQNQSGITYETLGINGASAPMLLDWDESILASEIAQRDPVLIVLAYGTNEALSPKFDPAVYREHFGQVVERFRRAAPTASILIVGPPDCVKRYRGRTFPFPHLDEVIQIQRRVALERGCAFWDWRTHMGGPGSVGEWVRAGLAQSDYVHLTPAGYRALGNMLLDEIMGQYNRFLAVRTE